MFKEHFSHFHHLKSSTSPKRQHQNKKNILSLSRCVCSRCQSSPSKMWSCHQAIQYPSARCSLMMMWAILIELYYLPIFSQPSILLIYKILHQLGCKWEQFGVAGSYASSQAVGQILTILCSHPQLTTLSPGLISYILGVTLLVDSGEKKQQHKNIWLD